MSLLAALAFLTILPLPARVRLEPAHLARATPWFPVVGLLLGLVLAGADRVFGLVLADSPRNALVVALALGLSGALHLDGLMDTCDGVFASVARDRRLEIMRDSHVGSFGVAGAGLVLIGKYAALASLEDGERWPALIAMAVLGRWAMTLAVAVFPAGRADGLGRLVKEATRPWDLLVGGFFAAVVCIASLEWAGGLLFAVVTAMSWQLGRALTGRLHGLTGDTYGALGELAELAALVLVPLCRRLLAA